MPGNAGADPDAATSRLASKERAVAWATEINQLGMQLSKPKTMIGVFGTTGACLDAGCNLQARQPPII